MSENEKVVGEEHGISNSHFLTPNSFAELVQQIQQTHAELTAQANKSVNVSLTLRNWLIGHHIAVYELQGIDRAQYGEQLFTELARQLKLVSNCNRRQLYRFVRLLNCGVSAPTIAGYSR